MTKISSYIFNSPIIIILLTSTFFGGCTGDSGDAPKLGTVSGIVTLDGKPLSEAIVIFQPEKGRPSNGETDETGRYTLQYNADSNGAVIGNHVVKITTAKSNNDEVEFESGDLITVKEKLPPKYHTQTELKAKVTADSNDINFDLKSVK